MGECNIPNQFTNKNQVNLYIENPNIGNVHHFQPGACKGCFNAKQDPPTSYDMYIECPFNDAVGTTYTFQGPATDLYVKPDEWGKWSLKGAATRNLGAWFGDGPSDWQQENPQHLLVSCLPSYTSYIDDQGKSLNVKFTNTAINSSDAQFCLKKQIPQNCNDDQNFQLCQGNNRTFVGVCDAQHICQRNTDVIIYDDLPVHACMGEEEGTQCYISNNKNSTCQKTSVGSNSMRCGPAETCIGEEIGTRCWKDVKHSEESTCEKVPSNHGLRCGPVGTIKPEVFLNSNIKVGVGDLPIKGIGTVTPAMCFWYCLNEATCDAAVFKEGGGDLLVQPQDNCWLKGTLEKDTEQLPLISRDGFTTWCIPGKCKS